MISSLFRVVKALFFILIILQFVPAIVVSTKQMLDNAMHPKTQIGLLPINGMITDASFYTKRLDAFLKDDGVKGLILRINSPGGHSGCCQAIFNELKHFAEHKPVVALIENVGASGSYYIAAASHTIIASPLSLVGSIGTYMEIANIKKLLTDWHIEHTYVQAGKYKTAGSMTKELTPDEAVYLQKLADDQYLCFVQEIAQARKLDATTHAVWADGQVFTGTRALEHRLIDKLGSITDAVTEIKKRAHIDALENIKLVQIPHQAGWLRQLLIGGGDETDSDGVDTTATVASFANGVMRQFCALQTTGSAPTSVS